MNKTLLTVGLVFLAIHCVVCAPKQKENEDNLGNHLTDERVNEVRKLFGKLAAGTNLPDKLEEATDKCPNMEEKFNQTIKEVHACMKGVQVGSNTVCATMQTVVVKCTKPVRELVSSCLPDASKELPLLLERGMVGILKQVCASTVEEILELFNPCQSEKNWSEVPSCSEVKTLADTFEKKLPSTKTVCSMIPKLKKCGKEVHSASCRNPITINVLTKFQNSVEQEIQEVCHN